jgi:hypothetical protein
MRVPVSVLIVCGFFLSACSDETPADIAGRLLPVIAQELIQHHDSSRLDGMTPEIKSALAKYPADEVTFSIGAPDSRGETGISFFTKRDHKRFLAIDLWLKASEDGYGISGVSQP